VAGDLPIATCLERLAEYTEYEYHTDSNTITLITTLLAAQLLLIMHCIQKKQRPNHSKMTD